MNGFVKHSWSALKNKVGVLIFKWPPSSWNCEARNPSYLEIYRCIAGDLRACALTNSRVKLDMFNINKQVMGVGGGGDLQQVQSPACSLYYQTLLASLESTQPKQRVFHWFRSDSPVYDLMVISGSDRAETCGNRHTIILFITLKKMLITLLSAFVCHYRHWNRKSVVK